MSEQERPRVSQVQRDAVEAQLGGEPKERGETYYHSDGLGHRKQVWLKHSPGMNIPIRVNTVWQPGILPDEEYDDSLEMNIGDEKTAWKLYKALEAYFNDVRTPPYWATDALREVEP
jgi:hypothetical protein